MKIDWFTFAAQIINFLILLALLKRFLYGPILKAIADREAEITTRFEQVDQQQSAAEAARVDYQTRTEELAHAKQQLLADAADEVNDWKSERLDEAKGEVQASRVDWYQAIERERGQLRADLLEQCQRDGLRMAEGVLKCLANQDVEQLIVDSFVSRLRGEEMNRESHGDDEAVTIRSAFELSDSQQQQLRAELKTHGFDFGNIRFRVDESLICGLEVRTRDHEISWNARESLDWLAAESARDLDQTLAIPEGLNREQEVSHAT